MRILKETPHRRALAALLSTAALVATPALAQVSTTTTPPPPVQSASPPAAPAPAAPGVQFAPAAPVVETLPQPAAVTPPPVVPTLGTAAATADQTPPPARGAARHTTRHIIAEQVRSARPAPIAAKPVVTPPAAAPAAATPAPVAAPATTAQTATTQTTTQTATPAPTRGAALWPWLLGGLIVLAGLIAAFAMRRRRTDEAVYEEAYVAPPVYSEAAVPAAIVAAEPTYLRRDVAEPVVTDPFVEAPAAGVVDHGVAPTEAVLATADAEDLAAITDGDATHGDRPWLEFSMRPVTARTDADEALVEIELTVGNAGLATATDVEISTFMFRDGHVADAEIERTLIEHESVGNRIDIAPGEGTRVDATLAVPRASLDEAFRPVIVADVRYRLPDGSEGRTHAAFEIGLTDGDGIAPIPTDRKAVHDDVVALLYGNAEHA